MHELTQDNVAEYLVAAGRIPSLDAVEAQLLGWGVSNVVIRLTVAGGTDFVVKQSRERLRTQREWRSRIDRIWREADALKTLGTLLPDGAVPRLLWEDRPNYLFAMEAVPAEHAVWKAELLDRRIDERIADTLGHNLATIHSGTVGDADIQARFDDQEIFHQLRVQPFYETVAERSPRLREAITGLIEKMAAVRECLVLADFSPKNILLVGQNVALVDFETAHYGDPAFDLGFFYSHLALKAIWHAPHHAGMMNLIRRFRDAYEAGVRDSLPIDEIRQRRIVEHFASCMIARVDGTSPVDYLNDPQQKDTVRGYVADILVDAPALHLESSLQRLDDRLQTWAS